MIGIVIHSFNRGSLSGNMGIGSELEVPKLAKEKKKSEDYSRSRKT